MIRVNGVPGAPSHIVEEGADEEGRLRLPQEYVGRRVHTLGSGRSHGYTQQPTWNVPIVILNSQPGT